MLRNPPPRTCHNNSSVNPQWSFKYRQDIDRLFAKTGIFAVLLHAFHYSIFEFGATGFDILFVISDILLWWISGLMTVTGEPGAFSFINIYSPLVGIFMPLIFCLLTFLVYGWLAQLSEYRLFCEHMAGGSYTQSSKVWQLFSMQMLGMENYQSCHIYQHFPTSPKIICSCRSTLLML